ncbi:MAG: M48 family metalloprotease [Pseudomonadota bacterium]
MLIPPRPAPWLLAAGLLLFAAGSGQADNLNLPDLGDQSAAVITPAQERKLGEDIIRQARRRMNFMDDPELNDYIQTLGQRLVASSDSPQQDFRFYIISDPSINAFAVPGGFISIHTGLLLAAHSEAELASVLAHEIAHITQRHIPRMIAEAQRISLPATAALLAAALLGASGHAGGGAAAVLTGASIAQHQINFTRAFEEEADRIGMTLLARSNFDPRAMPAFFEQMQNLNRHNETSLPEFLRTHPVTMNRIADSRNRAERFPYRQIPDSSEFHHARAKIRALTAGDPAEAVRAFRSNLAQGKYRDADAERYGYVLALTRTRQYEAARAEIRKLIERHPGAPGYRLAEAEIEAAAGRYEAALAIYATARQKFPGYQPLARAQAVTLINIGRAREAREILRAAIRHRPDDPALYRLLAQAAGDAGARIEAHQALAEAQYLSGNPDAAIEQLQLATRLAGNNFYLQSSIEARISAIREEMALYRGGK